MDEARWAGGWTDGINKGTRMGTAKKHKFMAWKREWMIEGRINPKKRERKYEARRVGWHL
jgi:hypothetical protein